MGRHHYSCAHWEDISLSLRKMTQWESRSSLIGSPEIYASNQHVATSLIAVVTLWWFVRGTKKRSFRLKSNILSHPFYYTVKTAIDICKPISASLLLGVFLISLISSGVLQHSKATSSWHEYNTGHITKFIRNLLQVWRNCRHMECLEYYSLWGLAHCSGHLILLLLLCGDVEVNPGPYEEVPPSPVPSLSISNLTILKFTDQNGQDETVKVLEKISIRWEEAGDLLGLTSERLKGIEVQRRGDHRICCRDVLVDWLHENQSDYPTTWEGVLLLLEDMELSACAYILKKKFNISGLEHVPTSSVSSPSISNLTILRFTDQNGQDRTVKVLEKISPSWEELGDLLGLTSEHLKGIELNRRRDIRMCCRDVLVDWLHENQCDYPTTWEGVLHLLEDLELSAIAYILKKNFNLSGLEHVSPSPVPSLSISNLTILRFTDQNGQDRTVKVLERISLQWEEAGNLLGLTSERLKGIEVQRRGYHRMCCRDVLVHWLHENQGDYPTTWEGVLQLLEDMDLSSCANILKKNFNISGLEHDYKEQIVSEVFLQVADSTASPATADEKIKELKEEAEVEDDSYPILPGINVVEDSKKKILGFSSENAVSFIYNGEKGCLNWKQNGLVLLFEDSLLPEAAKCPLLVSVGEAGAFRYPDNVEPASKNYHIDCPKNVSVKIRIYHNVHEYNIQHLCFITCSEDKPPYDYTIVHGGNFTSKFGEVVVTKFSMYALGLLVKYRVKGLLSLMEKSYVASMHRSLHPRHNRSGFSWNIYISAVKNCDIFKKSIQNYIKEEYKDDVELITTEIVRFSGIESNVTAIPTCEPNLHEVGCLESLGHPAIQKIDMSRFVDARPPHIKFVLVIMPHCRALSMKIKFTLRGLEEPNNFFTLKHFIPEWSPPYLSRLTSTSGNPNLAILEERSSPILDYKCVLKFVCVTAGIALLVVMLGTWTYFMITYNPCNVPEDSVKDEPVDISTYPNPYPEISIKTLLDDLEEINNWEILCTHLEVNGAVIDTLRHSGLDITIKKERCLSAYIDSGEATWDHVVKVVCSPPFNKIKLGKDIAKRHKVKLEMCILSTKDRDL